MKIKTTVNKVSNKSDTVKKKKSIYMRSLNENAMYNSSNTFTNTTIRHFNNLIPIFCGLYPPLFKQLSSVCSNDIKWPQLPCKKHLGVVYIKNTFLFLPKDSF